jgi:glutathione synthase
VKVLWVTDPWETLDHRNDTTLRLVQESLILGHAAWWCDPAGIRFETGRVVVRCRRVRGTSPERVADGWSLDPAADLGVELLDAVHYRVDPPVDRRYWEHLQLLALVCGPAGPELVNPSDVITRFGDKLGPSSLLDALPATMVSSSWETLEAFGRAQGRAVLKPLGDAQSRGVQLLDWGSPEGAAKAHAVIEEMSDGFARPVLLQRFLPEVYQGEKRLWFVDGELLAYVQKQPLEGSFVIDMDKGSACRTCELSAAEVKLASRIGDGFRAHRVRLAAVDLIGGHVTDWNLTSPGMIPTMERILGRNLAVSVIGALARRI